MPDTAQRIGPEIELAAAQRLSGGRGGRRLLSAAATHGLDVSLMWGVVDHAGRTPRVRQVCLAVPGAGRTAMVLLSGPDPGSGPDAQQLADRVACVEAACRFLGPERGVRLAQALPEPGEGWAVGALGGAGFVRVGELAYLRRPLPGESVTTVPDPWPPRVAVRNIGQVGDAASPGPDRGAVIGAMDRSYVDTLDCPELCGLRETSDVLDSHRATGHWNPDLWWIVELDGRPAGCLLLSHCPEQSSVELVYLGLAPELRGRGVAHRLLTTALPRLAGLGATHVACAVDTRNAPALKLYESLGFVEVTSRIGMVRRV